MRNEFGRFKKGHKESCKGFNDYYIVENKVIIIVGKKETIIDLEDFELVKPYRIYTAAGYAVCGNHLTGETVMLSRLIMNATPEQIIDHKNSNILDNRKENLRIANRITNAYNSKKRQNTTSRYKGTCFKKGRNKWRAYITVNKITIHLGHFNTEVAAALAYNLAATEYHGEFAKLNDIKD